MEKICGICGEDCGNRPRVKDARGRYFCRQCAEARVADRRRPVSGAPAGDADPYEIDAGASPLPVEMLAEVTPARSCPVCMRPLAPEARICIACGYDLEKGIQSSTLVEKSKGKGGRKWRCSSCGYDLKGLREPVCPECGTRVKLSKKNRLDEGIKSQVLQEEYLKPAVWFGIGFAVTAIVLAIRGEPQEIGNYAIGLAIALPLMWIGLYICRLLFLGDLGTPLLNLLRLAGALALGDAVDAIIPLQFMFMSVGLIVFWAVLMDLFEIDLIDAIWLGLVMGVIKIGAAVALVAVAASMAAS